MPASSTVPTLSQVRSWDTEHLTEAATTWTTTASRWEETFAQVAQQMPYPGGTPWVGSAAGAAHERASADLLKVSALANQLHTAAGIARINANQIDLARQAVLAAVDAAENAGFTVGEDFSVTSRAVGDASDIVARQAQAEAFAADIRARVGPLLA